MSATIDPFRCPGCHDGDCPDFDHYCDALEVPKDKTPQAFAAFLAGRCDWQGEYMQKDAHTNEEKIQ